MTNLVRIPLAWPVGTRSGSSQAKDPYIRNGVLDKYGDKLMIAKRPGTSEFLTLGGSGSSQGAAHYNGFYYGVCQDNLYRNGGVPASTSGAAWTQATTPTWPATEAQNAIVFKDRIFMIGGRTSQAGIWSTVDGLTWAVSSGGQPWGFRAYQGLVTFNDKMWILGGHNITLGTSFNDVWSSFDGANWDNVSLDGAAGVWSTRGSHCAIAANNGIYIYAGFDAVSNTYYNDVWYSPDGVNWQQLTASAPWTARAYASCFWFDDRLWIVGGIDSVGTVLNDVWSSPDGITWTQATAAAFATGRFSMFSCVYRDAMWAMGGSDLLSALTAVYRSGDGVTWTLVTGAPGWTGRSSGQAVAYKSPTAASSYRYPTLWILGGNDGSSTLDEVWYGDLDGTVFTSMGLATSFSGDQFQFNTYLNNTFLLLKNTADFFVFDGYIPIRVSDPNYPPATVPGVVTLNGRVYVMTPTGEIHGSALETALTWPALDFVTADYEDDIGVAIAKYLNYVVAFGQWTTQFFYDNGANQPTGSVLAPYINANLRVGCVTAASVATCGKGVYWVGQGDQAGRSVYTFNGLSAVQVSTPYIDRILMATAATAFVGIPAVCDGREYYVLKTANTTALAYDITNKEWYEWDTFPYQAYVTDFLTGDNFLYAITDNQLVTFSPTVYTDLLAGNFTLSCQTDKIDHGNTALKFCGRAVLVGDKSTAEPSITYSDDDYQTYRTWGEVNMALARPYLTRGGSFRRRAWRPTQTDNYPARWECLEVEYSQGES